MKIWKAKKKGETEKKRKQKLTDEMQKRFCKQLHEEQKFLPCPMQTSSASRLYVWQLSILLNLPRFCFSSFLSYHNKLYIFKTNP